MDPKQLHKFHIQNSGMIKNLGEVIDGKARIPVGILQNKRDLGTWLLGKTGSGKSRMIRSMVLDDIRAGKCVIYLDPYGNQVEAIIPQIVETENERLHYLNAQHVRNVLGLPTKDDIKNLIRAHQVMLVDLEINKLGADKVSTYGNAVLQRVYNAAQELFTNRKDIYLYIDDLDLFQKQVMLDILSHSEQLHLNVVVSTKSISLLDQPTIKVLTQNSFNKIIFECEQPELDWIGENVSKRLSTEVSKLQDLQFVINTEYEEGIRVSVDATPITD